MHRYLEDHPDCCVIDSFNNIYPVLDRLEIQEILLRLEDLKTEGHSTIRGPIFWRSYVLMVFLLWYCCIKFFFFQFNHGILLSEWLIGIYPCLLLYTKIRVRLDITYFAENCKHCSKIIFKCVNSTVEPIFNIFSE